MSRFFVYIIIFFCIFIIVGMHALYGIVAWVQNIRQKAKPWYLPYAIVTIIGILITLSILSYGYYIGRWKLEKNRVELTYASLPPAFDGYKIIHLSDLHLNTFIEHENQLQRIIDSVNNEQPDLICFTGDLISLDTTEIQPLASLLRTMKAKDGIYSVLGNHDFMLYGHKQPNYDSIATVMTRLETELLGWQVLNNEHATIYRGEDSITLAGCMNWSDVGFPLHRRRKHPPLQMGDLDKAIKGTIGFRVLLTHDPSQWHTLLLEKGRTDIALTLSGHTHCGQMRVGKWTPAKWFFDEVQGLYTLQSTIHYPQSTIATQVAHTSPQGAHSALYVNSGLGCTAPFRLAVPMEVTVIVLRSLTYSTEHTL